MSDSDTDHNDNLPSLPPDDEITEDYVPDPDMEEALVGVPFPIPPTHDAYFSLKYDSGGYYPERAGARFPSPPNLDEYDDPSTFRDHNHLDFSQAFEACTQLDFDPDRTLHYVTSHDPEEDKTSYVEFYLTEGIGHWHKCCNQELQPGEALVLIVLSLIHI